MRPVDVECSAPGAELTPAASKFLREGPAHALAGCDLWRHRCKSVRLAVLESSEGESNDIPRRAQRLSGSGVSLDITFELPPPPSSDLPNGLIGRLEVTTPRWPLLGSLRLGDGRAKALGMFGEPTLRSDRCWRYDDDVDDSTLCFERDRLASVQWSFFID